NRVVVARPRCLLGISLPGFARLGVRAPIGALAGIRRDGFPDWSLFHGYLRLAQPAGRGRGSRILRERSPTARRCLNEEARGRRRESRMTDARDIQHGVNDPVSGVDVKRRFFECQTPHERAQTAADVRREALPDPGEYFLPE